MFSTASDNRGSIALAVRGLRRAVGGLLMLIAGAAVAQTPQSVASYTLVNGDTGRSLGVLMEGATVNLAQLPTSNLNIEAATRPAHVGSVRLQLNSTYSQMENHLPYRLFGDNNERGGKLVPGAYTVQATPYTLAGGAGVAGKALAINFRVVDEARTNLLSNEGFELGNTGWIRFGTADVVQGHARSGSSALLVGAGASGRMQSLLGLAPNTAYRLSGWGKVGAAGEVGAVSVHIRDASGRDFQHQVEIRETAYTQKSVEFTTPSSVAHAVVVVARKSTSSGSQFYADDLALTRAAATTPPPAPLPPVAPAGPVQLKSALGTSLCMDVAAGNRVSGARLVSASCSSAESQKFVPQANGEIRSTNGLCVDAKSGAGNNGDSIQLYTCHGGANQKWHFTSAGKIRGINARLIDIRGANSTPGTELILWDDNGGANQRWSVLGATGPAPNLPPTVSLTAPAPNASFSAPAQITIAANAADGDGSIARVEFFAGSSLVGTVTSAPYQVTWRNVAAGNYALTARATDDKGAATSTPALPITVAAASVPPPPPPPSNPGQITPTEASRFLHQASFGATAAEIARLQKIGYTAWLDEQFAKPPEGNHVATLNAIWATRPASDHFVYNRDLFNSFWKHAATAEDQLRQRVAFALSEIFVVSTAQENMWHYTRAIGAYLDMLGRHAFGSYRALLEDVTLSPAMGQFLSHKANQKEDASKNRFPDQNFAREVMQLFSIGLVQLNPDGTPIMRGGGAVETYTNDDVEGLSKVFTGFSWAGPDKTSHRFHDYLWQRPIETKDLLPMQGYPQFHSTSEKRFLGKVIPASTVSDPDGDLKIALDTLAAHPNVAPFIARQLIQRLVTSNPSPQYVARVAQAFASGRYKSGTWSTGSGQRGDLRATIAAVLLDPEARDAAKSADARFGKLREPVLRVTAWMRAFNARPSADKWDLIETDDPANSLAQTPLAAPSVFNFFRPGYVPTNTALMKQGLVAPEFQITHEVSVVGYANTARGLIHGGIRNVSSSYAAEAALAHDPERLIAHLDVLLTYGTMTQDTRTRIRNVVNSIPLPAENQASARDQRARLAVWLALSAPEFLVQK